MSEAHLRGTEEQMTSSFTLPSKHVRSFPTANTIMLTYTVYRFFPEQEHFVHLLGTERCVLCGIRAAVGAGVWTKGTHFSVGRAHSPPAKQRANVFFGGAGRGSAFPWDAVTGRRLPRAREEEEGAWGSSLW